MDDPGWAWEFWKFGLKKDDLFTTLHDQYNTFPSSIQDPEAFHHDVFEITHAANTREEFDQLMADRKQQRLRELNDTLESASLEIIANPSLIGTEQWQYALQLFRTKSLDSLVRYFASYLPDDHPWRKAHDSASETSSNIDSIADTQASSIFDDGLLISKEPLSISTSMKTHDLPPSPRSMTMCSDSSVASPIDEVHHSYILNTLTPARTLSFSESDSEAFSLRGCPHIEDDSSQQSDPATPATSVSDLSESIPFELLDKVDVMTPLEELDEPISEDSTSQIADDDDDDDFTSQLPEPEESETPTPTPKANPLADPFVDTKLLLPHRRHRSLSPSRPHPLSNVQAAYQDVRNPAKIISQRRHDYSPRRRRGPGEAATRIQKPLLDPGRIRPNGRRRLDL